MFEVHFQSIIIRLEKPVLSWLRTPCWRVSQASLLPTFYSLATRTALPCSSVTAAQSHCTGCFSWSSENPLCLTSSSQQSTVERRERDAVLSLEKKGDAEYAALPSPEGQMSEISARVNAFFNKDIFFVEVTKFICRTNVCVCHIYIYVCVYFPYTSTCKCSYLRLTRSVHWIKSPCITTHVLFCQAKWNEVSSWAGNLSVAESKHSPTFSSFSKSW